MLIEKCNFVSRILSFVELWASMSREKEPYYCYVIEIGFHITYTDICIHDHMTFLIAENLIFIGCCIRANLRVKNFVS